MGTLRACCMYTRSTLVLREEPGNVSLPRNAFILAWPGVTPDDFSCIPGSVWERWAPVRFCALSVPGGQGGGRHAGGRIFGGQPWLDDACPRNTESQAISYAVKYIRRACPAVAWVQSFADERCGGLGVVYQASNILYCGSSLTTSWHLDGEWYHKLMLAAHRRSGGRAAQLRNNLQRATRHSFKQFRSVLFLKSPWRKRVRLTVRPYPKRQATW